MLSGTGVTLVAASMLTGVFMVASGARAQDLHGQAEVLPGGRSVKLASAELAPLLDQRTLLDIIGVPDESDGLRVPGQEHVSDAALAERHTRHSRGVDVASCGGAKIRARTGPEGRSSIGDGGWRVSLDGRSTVGAGDIKVRAGGTIRKLGIPEGFAGIVYNIKLSDLSLHF